ncbi:MAG: exodeoxyribonuclease VII large subunit, partial [Acutalibacteraceae bacterium]|nr:exodeoxyribonuclease VII large subunit [Acutalibacteraceae bacterium]
SALRERLNLNSTKMKSSYSNRVSESREAFAALCAKLDAMSPLATIARGYSVTYVDKKPIKSVDEVNLNDCLNVKLVDGVINCTVNNVSKE